MTARKPRKSNKQKIGEVSEKVKLNLEDIKEQMDEKAIKFSEKDLVPTGATMFNLACSGYASGGWKKGSINTLPGQSDAGKTFLAMSGLAEAASNKRFDKYDLIMNNSEVKGSFDLEELFPSLVGRLTEPIGGFSKTIQQFGGSIIAQCKTNRPFIQVLDSLDTLKADSDYEKSIEKAIKVAEGDLKAIKDIKKSYNAEKAKTIRKILGECNDMLAGTNSVLIIVQQLTQKMDASRFEDKWTSNGGTSPFYNSTHSARVMQGAKITQTINGNKIEIGNTANIIMKKNHLNGKKRNITFNIYSEYGIDDIESMCLFLSENMWECSSTNVTPSSKIKATEFSKTSIKFRDLVDLLWEDPKNNIKKLRTLTQEAWNTREKKLCTGRKRVF